MNSTVATMNIDTIEEYTLFALDRSQEGIDTLREDCRQCGEALAAGRPEAFTQLATLAGNLRDFNVFQKDIVSFFSVNSNDIRDARGGLQEAEDILQQLLDEFAVALESQDFTRLAAILREDLPGALLRFAELFPLLRNYIDVQYLGTTP